MSIFTGSYYFPTRKARLGISQSDVKFWASMKTSLLSLIVGFATLALMKGADTQTQSTQTHRQSVSRRRILACLPATDRK
jgi:hypothetical protein